MSCKVTLISECFVRPKSEIPESKRYYYLSAAALRLLSVGFSQYGVLFTNKSSWPSESTFIDKLNDSLSQALVYFYPLAGRFVTEKYPEEHSCSIFVDCTKGPGARLIHASAPGLTVNDITNLQQDVPLVVQSFFDLGERQISHDAHTRALVSLQSTELEDGIFVGCSISHCLADAISVSHFLKVVSQIFAGANISEPVIESSSFLSEVYPPLKLPYLEPDEFINRFDEGDLRDRIFHFSSESLAKLKAKANAEANKNKTDSHVVLSSLKALCGHLWMSINRAQKALSSEETTFGLAMNFRSRLNPPLPPNFFGSFSDGAMVRVKVGELLTNGLGWATMMIHQKVEEVSEENMVHEKCFKNTTMANFGWISANTVIMGGSPWLDLYKVDFGIGKPVAVRTGYTNRIHGKIVAFPGRHGLGGVDVQISLFPEIMSELLLDDEFTNYVS